MTVGIYTIEKTLFEGTAKEVIAKTTTGEISILPTHIPIVTRLEKGPLVIIGESDSRQTFEIERGFIEVRPESHIVVLVEAR